MKTSSAKGAKAKKEEKSFGYAQDAKIDLESDNPFWKMEPIAATVAAI